MWNTSNFHLWQVMFLRNWKTRMSKAGARAAWTDALAYIQQTMWKSLPHKYLNACNAPTNGRMCEQTNSDWANIENIEMLRVYSNSYIYSMYYGFLRGTW